MEAIWRRILIRENLLQLRRLPIIINMQIPINFNYMLIHILHALVCFAARSTVMSGGNFYYSNLNKQKGCLVTKDFILFIFLCTND